MKKIGGKEFLTLVAAAALGRYLYNVLTKPY